MSRLGISRVLSLLLSCGLLTASFHAAPEDIDIFSVDEGSNLNAPNVLIVLDNTSNWSRASQQWPGGEVQGQSEVAAIKAVINELNSSINVGLLEYITGGGGAAPDFGFVRSHIRPMNATNRATLSAHMDTIYANITAPAEKRDSSNPYGDLMRTVYAYLAGDPHPNAGDGTPASLADPSAYDTSHSDFRSPLTDNDTCTRTIVIFIGNNVNGLITADSAANETALRNLATNASDPPDAAAGAAAVEQMKHADYVVTTTTKQASIGRTPACYASAAACTSAVNNAACLADGFNSCACDAADVIACPSTHWRVVGRNTTGTPEVVFDDGPDGKDFPDEPTGENTTCSNSNVTPSDSSCTLPTGTTPAGPFANTPAPGQSTMTYTKWQAGTCAWFNTNATTGCTGQKKVWERHGTKLVRTVITQTNTNTTTTDLGETNACYNDAASCNPADVTGGCPSSTYNAGCACVSAGGTDGCPAGSTSRYMVKGTYTEVAAQQTGTYSAAPAGPLMMDEWARFLRQTGVTIPGVSARNQVTTYTIDVFNAQQSPELSGLWFNAAQAGGGRYFQAKDKQSIERALRQIFTEVQAVNTAFSSASLPINATNRSQNRNQIFIGLFRPDKAAKPLWFGNLKQFKAVQQGADIGLGDENGNPAVNNQTGFLHECSDSFWTEHSGNYWATVGTDEPPARGTCSNATGRAHSDEPDGPFVEKGAAAEVMRRGNTRSGADGSGNFALNRTVKTLDPAATPAFSTLTDFTAAAFDDGNAATNETQEDVIVRFIRGEDVYNNDSDLSTTEPRSTIHGDVVHSRPQPVDYGTDGVVVFYGANDGTYRAVKGTTGEELWSFIAPEHWGKLARLHANDPAIKYPQFPPADPPLVGPEPKDYFFDGSTGLFQRFNTDNTVAEALIFPTMRRGGRKVYAFDVTTPASPVHLWNRGCPNLTNDTGCSTGASAADAAAWAKIGQTWSLASAAFIKGYSETAPVIIFGGGYDRCDDDNYKFSGTPAPCAATKGRGVYVVDARTGALVKHFDFSTLGVGARGVAADIALISVNTDKLVDYAYAADTGGNIYRMDFVDSALASLAPGDWKFSRVAYTNGGDRKFLFTPALVQNGPSTVYLAIGSGDREHPLRGQYPFGTAGDPSTAVLNRFYVFKDDVREVDPATALNLDDTSGLDKMADYTTDGGCSTPPIDPGSTRKGWFMSLNANGQGEQVVTSAIIAKGRVNFSTNRPTPPVATACTTSLGEARGYDVNLRNRSGALGVDGSCGGASSSVFVGGGLPPSPVIATIRIGDRVETIVIGVANPGGGEDSAIQLRKRNPDLDAKRRPVYWYKSSGDN